MEATAKRHAGAGEDRLSSLPDELLHRILFAMSGHFAARTCVLSRRWRRVWSTCPSLQFNEVSFPRRRAPPGSRRQQLPPDDDEDRGPHLRFMNFVDRALIFNEAPNVTHLTISTREGSDMTRIRSWIYAAIKRNVTELAVIFKQKEQFGRHYLPTSLFYLQSLTKLVLFALDPQPLYWPRTGPTMALESLGLLGFRFTDSAAGDIISSSCPRLKFWTINRCLGLRRLDVRCPSLETFYIKEARGLRDLVVSGLSLTKITIDETFMHAGEGVTTSLEISAPKLRKFVWLIRQPCAQDQLQYVSFSCRGSVQIAWGHAEIFFSALTRRDI